MTLSGIEKLTVLGAGVLGGQIAWHSAYKGKQVTVYDINENALDTCKAAQSGYADIYLADVGATPADIEATRSRLNFSTNLADAVKDTDLVIEAVPEIPDIKTSVYSDLAKLLPEHTIIASNSSTFLPSTFAEATGRPSQFCCLHFANLIWAANIAEVMAHPSSSRDTLLAVTRFAIEIGMVPIPVRKEQNGYVLNTWFVELLKSSITLIANGVCAAEDVDRTFLIANPGAQLGPCAMVDIVGMTTAYNIASYWGEVSGDEQWFINRDYLKANFIEKNKMGMSVGEGFYSYPNPAFAEPDFLKVPDISSAEAMVDLIKP